MIKMHWKLSALLLFIVVFVNGAFSQAKLVLDSKEIDLGEIYNGEVVKARIGLKSAGKSPLKIVRISTSCGCTTVKQPQGDIPPGKADVLEVEFNSSGFRGKTVKYVYIESNDSDNQYSSVTLSALIREELQPVQNNTLIWFGDVPVGKKAEQTYALKNITPHAIAIHRITTTNKSIKVTFDQKNVPPGGTVTFSVNVTPDKTGYLSETFFVETDSKYQKKVPVRISLMGVQPQ
ncbi:MAG: DUF1573 domain-containing protein [Bacteroidota bacterium]